MVAKSYITLLLKWESIYVKSSNAGVANKSLEVLRIEKQTLKDIYEGLEEFNTLEKRTILRFLWQVF